MAEFNRVALNKTTKTTGRMVGTQADGDTCMVRIGRTAADAMVRAGVSPAALSRLASMGSGTMAAGDTCMVRISVRQSPDMAKRLGVGT